MIKKIISMTCLFFMLLPLVGFFHPSIPAGAVRQAKVTAVTPIVETWTANNATLQPLDTYLVAYWKAEDVNDSVDSHTLTNNNSVTFTSGKYNNAFTFDASNESLSGSYSADFDIADGDCTFSSWINFSSLSGYQCVFNTRWDVGNRGLQIYKFTGTNAIHFGYSTDGSTNIDATFAWSPSISTWYHLVISRIGTELKCYINASQIGSTYNLGTSDIYNNNYPIHIGNDGNDTAPFVGQIDEVAIWKGHGMTQDEITALYNSGTGSFYNP